MHIMLTGEQRVQVVSKRWRSLFTGESNENYNQFHLFINVLAHQQSSNVVAVHRLLALTTTCRCFEWQLPASFLMAATASSATTEEVYHVGFLRPRGFCALKLPHFNKKTPEKSNC